jgi:hypothetical protein
MLVQARPAASITWRKAITPQSMHALAIVVRPEDARFARALAVKERRSFGRHQPKGLLSPSARSLPTSIRSWARVRRSRMSSSIGPKLAMLDAATHTTKASNSKHSSTSAAGNGRRNGFPCSSGLSGNRASKDPDPTAPENLLDRTAGEAVEEDPAVVQLAQRHARVLVRVRWAAADPGIAAGLARLLDAIEDGVDLHITILASAGGVASAPSHLLWLRWTSGAGMNPFRQPSDAFSAST